MQKEATIIIMYLNVEGVGGDMTVDQMVDILFDKTTLDHEDCIRVGIILERLSSGQAEELAEIIIEIVGAE